MTPPPAAAPSPAAATAAGHLEAAPVSDPDGPRTAGRRWLAVRHETCYDHHVPVELAHHLAHLRPRDTARQRVHDWLLTIDPPPDGGVSADLDTWGNWRHAFSHATVHDRLDVVSSFRVALRLGEPMRRGGAPWEAVARQLQYQGGALAGGATPEATEFALASPYAARSLELATFARACFRPGRPIADAAWDFNRRVHAHFEYDSGATTVATPAAVAFSEGRGVCQDYAHVMIAALRSIGLAARYVSGYLLTAPPPGQPRLVGADASHAWVEVWLGEDGAGAGAAGGERGVQGGDEGEGEGEGGVRDDPWWALDPTNAIACGADHVTVAWGRDYGDVAPLRGVVRGGTGAAPQVGVSVVPIETDPDARPMK